MSSIAEEISRRLYELKTKSQEFTQCVSAIEANYEAKENEIGVMKEKIEQMKKTVADCQAQANEILNKANDEMRGQRDETARLLKEAQVYKDRSEALVVEGQKYRDESVVILNEAREKQKTADLQWLTMQEKERKIKEAVR